MTRSRIDYGSFRFINHHYNILDFLWFRVTKQKNYFYCKLVSYLPIYIKGDRSNKFKPITPIRIAPIKLDWLVSSIEFPNKSVMLINTNPRAMIAFASLQEILRTMSAKITPSSNLTLAIAGRGLDTQDMIDDPELSTSLAKAIATFAQSITH
jgi:hypothetical protein